MYMFNIQGLLIFETRKSTNFFYIFYGGGGRGSKNLTLMDRAKSIFLYTVDIMPLHLESDMSDKQQYPQALALTKHHGNSCFLYEILLFSSVVTLIK